MVRSPRPPEALLLPLLLLIGCSGAQRASPPAAPPEPVSTAAVRVEAPASAPPEPLAAELEAAERQGWLEGDGRAYFALFAPDVRVVAGRGPQPDQYEVRFRPSAFRTAMHYQFLQARGNTTGLAAFAIENVQEQAGARARRVTQIRRLDDIGVVERVHETYSFELRAGSWRVVALRYHPWSLDGANYDDAKLRELDAAADIPDLPLAERARALFTALRYAEALPLFRSLASEPTAAVDDWVVYGYCALFAGDDAAAEDAFTRARQLDPNTLLPPPPEPSGQGSATPAVPSSVRHDAELPGR